MHDDFVLVETPPPSRDISMKPLRWTPETGQVARESLPLERPVAEGET